MAALILEVVDSEQPPFRLLLGTDAVNFADNVMADRQQEYAAWRAFSVRSDYEK